jgi:hypothetical protein
MYFTRNIVLLESLFPKIPCFNFSQLLSLGLLKRNGKSDNPQKNEEIETNIKSKITKITFQTLCIFSANILKRSGLHPGTRKELQFIVTCIIF